MDDVMLGAIGLVAIAAFFALALSALARVRRDDQRPASEGGGSDAGGGVFIPADSDNHHGHDGGHHGGGHDGGGFGDGGGDGGGGGGGDGG